MNRNCSACNINIDINNYKKDRTVCKSFYKIIKRKNNNNTLPPNTVTTSRHKTKAATRNDNNNKNRPLIIGFSSCGKS